MKRNDQKLDLHARITLSHACLCKMACFACGALDQGWCFMALRIEKGCVFLFLIFLHPRIYPHPLLHDTKNKTHSFMTIHRAHIP